MTGAMSRRKGAAAEREVAALLCDHLGTKVVRNLQQTRDGGHDLMGVGRFALEVKRCEAMSLGKWWRQACDQAALAGMIPALAYRQSRQPWRFVVPVSTLLGNHADYQAIAVVEVDGFAMICREGL